MYVVLDHTRTLLMIISDGALPSNKGGGKNVRNILRRVFAILKKYKWWDVLKMDGLITLFETHKKDLEGLYGKFPEYKSFRSIIEIEYERWLTNADEQKGRLKKLLKKRKNKLQIKDWIVALTSWGIPAEMIQEVSGLEPPSNLHSKIAELQERNMKSAEQVLYNTTELPETKHLYHNHPGSNNPIYDCNAKIVTVINNIQDNLKPNLVVLNGTTFYPNAGGQQCDNGIMRIGEENYKVVNVEQVGKVVMHELDRALPNEDLTSYEGLDVTCKVDRERRHQLRNHHTATHIIFASCRQVLGPHVWQHGAKKTVEKAHLDITHYSSLTKQQEQKIENTANQIILQQVKLTKGWIKKSEAEKEHGFRLYQGGVVPGNNLRVVQIDGIDVEACCGTHCENTGQVGWIKITSTNRISDGTLRLNYVAGKRVISVLNEQSKVLQDISQIFGISQDALTVTAQRFFNERNMFEKQVSKNTQQMMKLQVRCVLQDKSQRILLISKEENASIYFNFLGAYAEQLKQMKKGLVYVGKKFIFGIVGEKNAIKAQDLQGVLTTEENKKPRVIVKNKVVHKIKKKKTTVKDVTQFTYVGPVSIETVIEYFKSLGFIELDL